MRRHDKKTHMDKVNKLFEERCIQLGDDIECNIEETENEDCGCEISEDEASTQWFSDEAGRLATDKIFN